MYDIFVYFILIAPMELTSPVQRADGRFQSAAREARQARDAAGRESFR